MRWEILLYLHMFLVYVGLLEGEEFLSVGAFLGLRKREISTVPS